MNLARLRYIKHTGLNPLSSIVPRSAVYLQGNGAFNRRFLTTAQYHELADESLEAITDSYERLIEQKPEIDVDLSQGVLTVVSPPVGTYVLNKQPPNLQIWLSSPISGPKRYDWDEENKRWIYLRDQSTLGALLKQEVRESFHLDLDLDIE